MDFVEVYRAFYYFCLKLCPNHDHFGRFQTFCSTLCDLRAFRRLLQTSGIMVFLVQKVDFEPPLWILWRCAVDFIKYLSNYVWFITILFNLRYFARLGVASGLFKDCSKLAELRHFCWKRSNLSHHYGFCWGVQRILRLLSHTMFGLWLFCLIWDILLNVMLSQDLSKTASDWRFSDNSIGAKTKVLHISR